VGNILYDKPVCDPRYFSFELCVNLGYVTYNYTQTKIKTSSATEILSVISGMQENPTNGQTRSQHYVFLLYSFFKERKKGSKNQNALFLSVCHLAPFFFATVTREIVE